MVGNWLCPAAILPDFERNQVMAQTTITALFSTFERARQTVNSLEAAGIPSDDISLIANNADHSTLGAAAGTGAGIGALGGGAVGLMTGLGLMAIPGLGPVVAAGWLASMAAGAVAGGALGAAAGGLAGALSSSGVEDEEAQLSLDGLRQGGALVVVRADDTGLSAIRTILEQEHLLDMQEHGGLDSDGDDDWKDTDRAPLRDAIREEIERGRVQR